MTKVHPLQRLPRISHAPVAHNQPVLIHELGPFQKYLPISKLTDRTEPTLRPGFIPILPGARHNRFVTFWCETSTPLGVPVVPTNVLVGYILKSNACE